VKDNVQDTPEVCPSSGFYTISQGYRKVAGNSCEGGVQHASLVIRCSSAAGLFSLNLSNIIWVVILAGIGYIIYGLYKGDSLDSMFSQIWEILDFAKAFIMSKIEDFRGSGSGSGGIIPRKKDYNKGFVNVPESINDEDDEEEDDDEEDGNLQGALDYNDGKDEEEDDNDNLVELGGEKKKTPRGGVNSAAAKIPKLKKPD
jgi:hypothetical protein